MGEWEGKEEGRWDIEDGGANAWMRCDMQNVDDKTFVSRNAAECEREMRRTQAVRSEMNMETTQYAEDKNSVLLLDELWFPSLYPAKPEMRKSKWEVGINR